MVKDEVCENAYNANLKPYLVDVPVKLNIWIRPECQRKQFEVIKKARPHILFLQSDGGRNDKEKEIIEQHRKMFDDEIDWDCIVYKIYSDVNLGLYEMGRRTEQFIFEKVDRCIFTEDDQIPSLSFFQFCADLLEKYKNDLRVVCICGNNNLVKWPQVESDYFFTRAGSIWGIAYWKRSYEQFYDFLYGKDSYIMNLLKNKTRCEKESWNRIVGYSSKNMYEGHVAGTEFFIMFATYAYNQVVIMPKYNLISNIGLSEESAHADPLELIPSGVKKLFFQPTYELKFPLKDAQYVIDDRIYEKKAKRLLGVGHPFIRAYRKIEQISLLIMHGQFKRLFYKTAHVLKGRKET